jgi:hypothetical protein
LASSGVSLVTVGGWYGLRRVAFPISNLTRKLSSHAQTPHFESRVQAVRIL